MKNKKTVNPQGFAAARRQRGPEDIRILEVEVKDLRERVESLERWIRNRETRAFDTSGF